MRFLTLAATSAALLLTACGGGGGGNSAPGFNGDVPLPSGGGTSNMMDANAWTFGPTIDGRNYSPGMPTHPTATAEGFTFDIPVAGITGSSVHYVTRSTGSLAGKSKIVLKYRLDLDPGVNVYPTKFPTYPPLLTLYFQRSGDDWSGKGDYETYRWWASFATVTLKAGEGEIVAPLDANWTAVSTSNAQTKASAFASAKQNASRIGFTFGGGDGLGHGVSATGPAYFTVTDFHVE